MTESLTVDVNLTKNMRFHARNARGHTTAMDATPPGGEGSAPTPMELILAALGGCTGMDVISILRKMRQEVSEYHVEVTGERASTTPHPYESITIRHVVCGRNVSEEAVDRAVDLSESKYCPVYRMLSPGVRISTTVDIRSEVPGLPALAQTPLD